MGKTMAEPEMLNSFSDYFSVANSHANTNRIQTLEVREEGFFPADAVMFWH